MKFWNKKPSNKMPAGWKPEQAGNEVPLLAERLLIQLVDPDATAPRRATDGSAGFDLYSPHHYTLFPFSPGLIDIGVKMAIPEGWCGMIWPRSGKSIEFSASIDAGLIDSDYRKTVGVALFNKSDRPWEIRRGDRIAQIVIVPYLGGSEIVSSLPDPGTRFGGFGSTGV